MKIVRIILTSLIVFFYIFGIIYLSINNEIFRNFVLKFLNIFKNSEIGEGLFGVIFIIIPISIIIWSSDKIGKRFKK